MKYRIGCVAFYWRWLRTRVRRGDYFLAPVAFVADSTYSLVTGKPTGYCYATPDSDFAEFACERVETPAYPPTSPGMYDFE